MSRLPDSRIPGSATSSDSLDRFLEVADEPAGLVIGTSVGPYRVARELGSGGMGVVYEAEDTRLGRRVALKFLSGAHDSAAALERFRREARAASALNHPHICVVHELGEHEGAPFIAMERMTGETLRERLSRGPLTADELVHVGSQLADALAAAHAAGIVHRDIKPSNIFITERGDAKLLDFGLAGVGAGEPVDGAQGTVGGEPLTKTGAVMGTAPYMSPEQCLGKPLDGRSDIFSLGVVLYECATGRRPFEGRTPTELHSAIVSRPVAPPSTVNPGIPRALQRVLLRALENETERRYPEAAQLRDDLTAAAVPAWLRRARQVAVPVLALALVAAGGWAWHRAARIRWARGTALPQAQRLDAEGHVVRAFLLAREARAVLPGDAALEAFWQKISGPLTFVSTPPGAELWMRDWDGAPDHWVKVGTTPLRDVTVPSGIAAWRLTLPSFAPTVFLGSGTRGDNEATLVPASHAPPGTVFVDGDGAVLGWPYADGVLQRVPAFFIDEHEVTNAEYQRFVDSGAYTRPDPWAEPFDRDGRRLAWDEAMRVFVDATGRPGPATWIAGHFPAGTDRYPVSGVSWFEAAAYARWAGKSLPTVYHWRLAAQVDGAMLIASAERLPGNGPREVGALPSGSGTTDMAGNLKEWCWNEDGASRRFILGGSWGEPSSRFSNMEVRSPWERLPTHGFRSMKRLEEPEPRTMAPVGVPPVDYLNVRPVSDEVFATLERLYAYDATPLRPTVEQRQQTEHWIHETVTIDAARGRERYELHLFKPLQGRPPFQAVIYFGGGRGIMKDRFEPGAIEGLVDFVPRSGRVLVWPVLKGTFERHDDLKGDSVIANPSLFRDHGIDWVKDTRRAYDYLETRPDIDHERIALVGISTGAEWAPLVLGIEHRFKAAVLLRGGYPPYRSLPEVDLPNFVPRVRTPLLLVGARFDMVHPVEESQKPLMDQLGTPPADRRHVQDRGGFFDNREEDVRESLAWLDRYLGPVR